MAVIDLKDVVISILDGLSGTADGGPVTAPVETDTAMDVANVALNTSITDQIPIGARFTIAGETDATVVHTVTARTPTSGSTTNITFSPALGPGTYTMSAALTFQSQKLDIKIGQGNLTYSEHRNIEYRLNRGKLDTTREGDEVPMDVSLDADFEHIISGTGEDITPTEAMKGMGAAAEWVSSATDKCEPYAVDIEALNALSCGTTQSEDFLFPDFRWEQGDFDFQKGTIAFKGKCNAKEPVITRS